MGSQLDSFMKQNGMTDAQFAALIGRDRSLVNRLRNGSALPTLEVAAIIERETDGSVPMNGWLALEDASDHASVSVGSIEQAQ
ncbi:helix-turn-helix domain-containing protein [Sphingomonas sp. Leaf343]|uniref:helix-turn-helix domain-containing protein n=1 Tax=Sphingomonas sp. Leaf343 TaxID=1736345 RepID=UPI0014448896|nr:helix-turn-helix transcriptional regulator [Sphingomonas sp. Leaf343]